MEELHAAIAAHLRAQRRQLAKTGEREAAILNIWQDPYAIPRCKVCGVPIESDGARGTRALRAVLMVGSSE